jgi:hypothetical protein
MDIDLEQARRRAKELLRAARRGETRLRDDREPLLADAQRAVARDLGFPSWPALVAHVEASQGDRQERRRRLMAAALGGRDDLAERLLAHDPALANAGLDVALVLGDAPAVAAALDADPELVGSDLPDVGRKALSCACHSVFLRPSSPRAPGVRRTIELLLDRGAEVNDVGGPREAPSTPLGWTAWGSRMLPGATERLEGYREATRLLVAAGARVEPGMIEVAADDVAVVLEEASPLSAARVQWGERGEIELDTGLEYARGVPVRVHVRKRAPRYELDDMGGALASAGEPEGWMPVGERVVADQGLNVNRPGRVFVQVAEGRDLDRIARQVAETSLAVYAALLEL